MNNLKLTLVMGAVVAALSGCGGGGNDNAGVDNSAITLSVTPNGDQNLPANSSMKLSMATSVRRTSTGPDASNKVASMAWTVTPLGSELKSPVLSNAACAGSNISGAQAGCETLLSIPADVTTGRFNVIATAKASNGTQRSESFILNVNNTVYTLTAGDAQITPQEKNGTFGVVTLKGNLSGQNGPKIVSMMWKQVDGPATVQLANEATLTPTFIPTALGTYTFELTVVADDKTFTARTTVEAQPPAN